MLLLIDRVGRELPPIAQVGDLGCAKVLPTLKVRSEMRVVSEPESSKREEGNSRGLSRTVFLCAPWLLLLVYWIQFWNRLRIEWSVVAQYAYGWFVPFLAIGLLYLRWQSRPAPQALRGMLRTTITVVIILVLLLHIPISLVEEANLGWRPLFWFREFWLLGVSLAAVALVGGWSWVRHFAFPFCFTAIAVPWPMELALTQTLMEGSAAVAVEVLNIAGFAAVRHGNLIEVAAGVVGVDEACSGVRGLQTSLMVSLLLGELGRFSLLRRLLLALAAVAIALLLNLARTIALSLIAANQGLGAVDKWHDLAGGLEFGGIFAGMALSYWLLRPRVVQAPDDHGKVTAGSQPISLRVSVMALLTLIGGAATTAAWYGLHESSMVSSPRWTIQQPVTPTVAFPNLVDNPIPDRTWELLRALEGWSYSWSEPEGLEFRVFYFKWPRASSPSTLAGHRPEICMPAAGFVLDRLVGTIDTAARGIPLQFRQYLFHSQNGPVYAFYCFWEYGQISGQSDPLDRDPFDAVLAGHRLQERQMLQLFLTGARDDDQAAAALKAAVEKLVVQQ